MALVDSHDTVFLHMGLGPEQGLPGARRRLRPAGSCGAVLNGPHKTLEVRWAGKVVFRVTVYDIPAAGCTTPAFTWYLSK